MPTKSNERDPFQLFSEWFKQAEGSSEIKQANAMCLSTLDLAGYPDGRMVLLKGNDERGFVFYTNLKSVKGRSLAKLPKASLTFHWDPLEKQIRIQGDIEKVTDREADAYWKTRPRLAQVGAWASQQSEELASHKAFIQRLTEVDEKFENTPVPRPPHWTGLRVKPTKIEFWRGRRGRLHERLVFRKSGASWKASHLYP